MKNLFMLLLIASASFFVPQQVQAQETVKQTYTYTDLDKGVTYQVLIKVSGYQVEIWYTSTSSKGTPPWTKATVLYSDDDYIKYQVKYNNWQYELTTDPYNESAIYIKNISTNGKKYRYFLKQ